MSDSDQHQFKDRYMLRLPDGMRDRIKAAADANNRSMNAEIVATLAEVYPPPKTELDFISLAEWIDYVQRGGPESEYQDRVIEVNERLAKYAATPTDSLKLQVKLNPESERPELIISTKSAEIND